MPKKIEFTTFRRSTEVKLRIIVDVRGDWSYSTALFIESPPSAQLLSISEGKQETSNRNNFVNKCHRPVGFGNLTSCPLGSVFYIFSHKHFRYTLSVLIKKNRNKEIHCG